MSISRCIGTGLVPLLVLAGVVGAQEPTLSTGFIVLRGDGPELGVQHGHQLGSNIRALHQDYLRKVLGENFEQASQAAMAFAPFISEPHMAELRKLAEVSKIDLNQTILAQCVLDLDDMVACSTITLPAGASPDGVARFGRNLDFPSLGVLDKTARVLVFLPEGRNSFVAVTWPGLIGVLSGMNEHGLTLASMEISRARRKPSAMPYMLLYRTVLEQCRDVDEAIALLDKTPKQTANNLMLMDAAGARALVEITPERITVRRADDRHALVSTNHHRGENFQTRGRCPRYDALMSASDTHFGKIGVEDLHKMLEAVQQGDDTIQTMIFEPGTRMMYLSLGSKSASRQFMSMKLDKFFEPSRKAWR
jgi:predicted choloylglycine hydrolase